MRPSNTLEDFVENYLNKKKTSEADSYREWLITSGINSSKLYKEALRDINGDYNRAKSEYGTRAEKLGQLGLSASGYSDYLTGKAYSEMQKRKAGAKNAYSENEMKNLSGYQKYLKEKNDEATRLFEGVITDITNAGIMDYEKAYSYAVNSGLDEEAAASAAKKASDTVHKNVRNEVLNQIILRKFEDSQAREYALAMGLGEYEADELAEYAFKINQAVHYSESYLEYLESQKENNKKK